MVVNWKGIVKSIFFGVSLSLFLLNDSVLMFISSFSEFISASLELSWLMEVSVWRKFCRSVGFRSIRFVVLIIFWVMVCSRLYGLSIVSITSLMCGTRRVLIGMVGKSLVVLILSIVRSVRELDFISNVLNIRLFCKATMI